MHPLFARMVPNATTNALIESKFRPAGAPENYLRGNPVS